MFSIRRAVLGARRPLAMPRFFGSYKSISSDAELTKFMDDHKVQDKLIVIDWFATWYVARRPLHSFARQPQFTHSLSPHIASPFNAPHRCGPCVKISPFFAKLAEEHTDVAFAKVDVDDCEQSAQAFGVEVRDCA